ncbi:MAG: class II fructose-bisphosphatase [Alphaproteobacteria bacterium]
MADALDPDIAFAAVRITEQAAIEAARHTGRGDERTADGAAIDAACAGLADFPAQGKIVVGEGLAGSADRLFIGEGVGQSGGSPVHIAVDPLEGATTTARGGPNALSILAVGCEGGLVRMPDIYMEKIAVGPGLPEGVIDLDRAPGENLAAVAAARGVGVGELVVCILDRPRHADLVTKVREAGARIALIQDGDVSGIVATAVPAAGTDLYMGIGGAPEGVLAAAALRSTGGQMRARLVLRTDEDRAKALECGHEDFKRIFSAADLAPGDVIFAATGVTQGMILKGVRRVAAGVHTQSLIVCSGTSTVRWLDTYHDGHQGAVGRDAADPDSGPGPVGRAAQP